MICDECSQAIHPTSQGAKAGSIEWLTDQYGVGMSSSIRKTHRACSYFRNPQYKMLMTKMEWFDRWLPLYEFDYHRPIYDEQLWSNQVIADHLILKILQEAR